MASRKGILFKWTNYVHGWQSRFFVVKNGILMYYRSEQETSYGCRGAISIMASTLTLHEFDCCRFDVGVSDYVWYLRASSKDERDEWLQVLTILPSSEEQQPPIIQLQHQQQQLQSQLQQPQQQQQDEPSEFFFDAIDDQIMMLENNDDKQQQQDNPTTMANILNNNSVLQPSIKIDHHGSYHTGSENGVDQLDKDTQETIITAKSDYSNNNIILDNATNDENNLNINQNLKTIVANNTNTNATTITTTTTNTTNNINKAPQSIHHPLWPKIDLITSEQLFYAQMGLGQQGSHEGWQLFAEDGQMRMYTREMEIDGLVCDPLKAVHVVRGITGFEMCHRFFSPDVRFEWEQTLETMKVVEEIDKNTQIFHQIHKRVWPAAQRDAVFWSHIRQVAEPKASCLSPDDINPINRPDLKLHSVWMVCNNSADKPDIPLDRCVRVRLTVSLVCETYISANLYSNLQGITRDDLTCKIIYSSTINPGGWAPASVLRTLYKREYPRFLSNFANYVINSTKNKPITFK